MAPAELESRAAAVFLDAIARDEGARDAFLDSACAADPGVRSRVLELLAADRASSGFLERGAAGAHAEEPMIGRQVGRYTISRLIGRGGMGAVYEAAQTEPERSVALKIMSPWLVSRETLRRFARESRVLARLHHAGIVQVYETGTWRGAEDAREVPYFAMEFVPRARTILRYTADERLDRARVLELFAFVCDSVAHGHAHGVIHRDLKPANILVDESGRPKVIDFGVARAAGEHAAATLHTSAGQMIGTPTYMSPEQAAGDPDAIDVRSDVYSMGAILYELLTGLPPLDVARVSLARLPHFIRETVPPPPSVLDRSLRGDLDTIVLKALDKAPARRYQSAADLGRDIRRFVEHQPIEARPPTRAYLAAKFARRHRAAVVAAAVAVTALIAGTSLALWQALRATRAEAVAKGDRRTAQRQTVRARSAVQFLSDVIGATASAIDGDQSLILRSLDRMSGQLNAGDYADEPELEEQLRRAVANSYHTLGFPHLSIPHNMWLAEHRSRGGDGNDKAWESLHNLAGTQIWAGRTDETTFTTLERTLASARRVFGDEDWHTFATLHMLGEAHRAAGRPDQAEALIRQASDGMKRVAGEDAQLTLFVTGGLADLYASTDRQSLAEPLFAAVVAGYRRTLGRGSVTTLRLERQYAERILGPQGRSDEAIACLRDTLEAGRASLGLGHPETLATQRALAAALQRGNDVTESRSLWLDALVRAKAIRPRHDIGVREAIRGLVAWDAAAGDLDATIAWLRTQYTGQEGGLSTDLGHAGIDALREIGPAAAEPLLRASLRIMTEEGLNPGSIANATSLLGQAVSEQGRPLEAEPLLLEGYRALAELRPRTRYPIGAADRLVAHYERAGRADEAACWRAIARERREDAAQTDEPASEEGIGMPEPLLPPTSPAPETAPGGPPRRP